MRDLCWGRYVSLQVDVQWLTDLLRDQTPIVLLNGTQEAGLGF